jgi:hypothetical protein
MERQQQFKYKEASITSSRLTNFFIDIKPMIVELVVFESLDKPYVTGQIAISDDKAIFDGLSFSGTEKLKIKMLTELSDAENGEIVMDREFILTGIDTAVKSSNSGQSSIYVLSFMDEHAVVSKSKLISRAIKDDLKIEILKLVGNECGKDVDLSYIEETPPGKHGDGTPATPIIKTNFKGIIPYMHPLEAAQWLVSKSTTQLGMPVFLYASIHDEKVRLGTLEKMLQQKAWNDQIPYLFSPSNTQKQEENPNPDFQYFQVQTMKTSKIQNTMKQLMAGGLGARYTVTDLSNGRTTSQHYSFYRSLGKADEAGVIDITKQNVYNDLYKTPDIDLELSNGSTVNIEGDYLHNLDAQAYHKVVSRGVYGDKKSLHDEVNSGNYLKEVEAAAYRNAIFKNMFDVTVPGPGFIRSEGSVGDRIRINVLSDDNDPDSPQPLDKLRSGDFIIYNTRHTFKDTRHDVAMTVFKFEKGPNDEVFE